MTVDTALFNFVEPTDLVLEITTEPNQVWLQTQSFSTPASRYQAYLNQLCLSAVLPWLQEEYSLKANPWPSVATLPSFWEVVNGTAIEIDGIKLVLVPSEAIDLSELRVPQEWVDIPRWAADYYLAVQVEPDEGWVRIGGYCTHQQLKSKGSYDAGDRTYCLDEDDLITDISVLWVARQLCPEEATQTALAPLRALPLTQAENLLQRLGNPDVVAPRLAVPFELWGALLEHGGWRQRLYERRNIIPDQWSSWQWLREGVSDLAEQVGWGQIDFQQGFVGAKGVERATEAVLSRPLAIAGQRYELQIIPLEEGVWRFELRNSSGDSPSKTLRERIPGGFKLRILTEDLQPFGKN